MPSLEGAPVNYIEALEDFQNEALQAAGRMRQVFSRLIDAAYAAAASGGHFEMAELAERLLEAELLHRPLAETLDGLEDGQQLIAELCQRCGVDTSLSEFAHPPSSPQPETPPKKSDLLTWEDIGRSDPELQQRFREHAKWVEELLSPEVLDGPLWEKVGDTDTYYMGQRTFVELLVRKRQPRSCGVGLRTAAVRRMRREINPSATGEIERGIAVYLPQSEVVQLLIQLLEHTMNIHRKYRLQDSSYTLTALQV